MRFSKLAIIYGYLLINTFKFNILNFSVYLDIKINLTVLNLVLKIASRLTSIIFTKNSIKRVDVSVLL